MKKKLPVGVEFFENFFTKDYYYVDKTMFIADLLQNMGEVNLFTRPRRFGKTLTMDMLKCFFETGTDKKLFEGLKISQETDLCEKYMGQFPVISVTLKSAEGLNYQAAVAALRRVIGDEASRFYFLKGSTTALGIFAHKCTKIPSFAAPKCGSSRILCTSRSALLFTAPRP